MTIIDKSVRQHQSLNTILDNNFNGILNYCVRFGKTRIGIQTYLKYRELIKPKDIILILVPSLTIKKSWLDEIAVLNLNPEEFNIITIGQTLNIGKFPKVSLLIVDECHKFTSDRHYDIIHDKIKYTNIIMLTGSLPANPKLKLLTDITPVIDVITEQEAIHNKWISNYVEYNIPLNLNEDDMIKYVKYTNDISAVFSKYKNLENSIVYNGEPLFKDLLDLLLSLANGKYSKYGYIDSIDIAKSISIKMGHGIRNDNLWEVSVILDECKIFQNALKNRNTILISNKIKLDAVLEIYNKLQKPTICFNESIGFADSISDNLNKGLDKPISVSYHSKLTSQPLIDHNTNDYYRYKTGVKAGEPKVFSKGKQLLYFLECINHGIINFLSTVKSLDEGVTISNIECIITTSGSMNPIQYEQRTGRGKTLVDDDKVAKIYNLYFDDFEYEGVFYKSRDKVKLLERQRFNPNVSTIFLSDI
jgi:superfamily II DNA or RNA helicase